MSVAVDVVAEATAMLAMLVAGLLEEAAAVVAVAVQQILRVIVARKVVV
jgi:hypothetical protein